MSHQTHPVVDLAVEDGNKLVVIVQERLPLHRPGHVWDAELRLVSAYILLENGCSF